MVEGKQLRKRGAAVPGYCRASGNGASLDVSELGGLLLKKDLRAPPFMLTAGEIKQLDYYEVSFWSNSSAAYTHVVTPEAVRALVNRVSGDLETHIMQRVGVRVKRQERLEASLAAKRAALKAKVEEFLGKPLSFAQHCQLFATYGFFGPAECDLTVQYKLNRTGKAALPGVLEHLLFVWIARIGSGAPVESLPNRPCLIALPARMPWAPTSISDVANRANYPLSFKREFLAVKLIMKRTFGTASAEDMSWFEEKLISLLTPVLCPVRMRWVSAADCNLPPLPSPRRVSDPKHPADQPLVWAAPAADLASTELLDREELPPAGEFRWVVEVPVYFH